MNLEPLLNDEEKLVRDSARRFAERHGGTARARKLKDAAKGYDVEAFAAAAEAGWIGLLAPEALGGAELGEAALCLIAEELGRQLCVAPVGAAAASALALAELARSNAGSKALFERVLAGKALVLPALGTEPVRVGASSISLNAEPNGAYRVSGRWEGLPALSCDGFIVEASGAGGHALLWVEASTEGVTLQAARAVDGSALATLVLENALVPSNAVIANGVPARVLAARINAVQQLAIASEMLGLVDAALAKTLEYLGTRVQFGQPIGKFQALRHGAVDNYVSKETVRSLILEAAHAAGSEHGPRLATAARVLAGEASLAICKSCIQMHGAIGFTDEHDIGLFLKRAMALQAQCGTTGGERRRYRRGLQAQGQWVGVPSHHQESAEDARFRAEVREWLEANLPTEQRHSPTRLPKKDVMAWHRKLFERGWIAPGWPREHGGMGATLTQQVILSDELARIGAPEISGQAINHIGPILIRYGTEAQKRQHLPKMLSGECVWCQGYSEPNAGSDLASLQTRAEVKADHLIVNGQKIWTTWAHNADWIFALVRTNPQAPRKQEGISFILMDMRTPGISPRGIRTIAGDEELATVFFDDVKVPMDNVVGTINGGWKIANALLVNERLGSASTQRDIAALRYAWRVAAAAGLNDDEAFVDRLAMAEIELLALTAAHGQAVSMLASGHVGAESSFMKIAGTALLQRLSDLLLEAASALGGGHGRRAFGEENIDAAAFYLQNRRATIYGGTQEIQKDIVAKRVLNMP